MQFRQSTPFQSAAQPTRPFQPSKPQSKPMDKDFAKFEQYTKGIGSKLLKKMGYTPGQGLGADGSGIVEPIDVKLRPQKMGLGHGGFDERTKAVKKEQSKKEDLVEEQPRQVWKKSKKKKQVTYKTAQEVVQEQMQESVKPIKILDMTGKDVKVLDSMSGLTMHISERLPELKYNLGILADTYHAQLSRESRVLKDEKSRLEYATQEETHLKLRLETDSKFLTRITTLFKILQEIKIKMESLQKLGSGVSWDAMDHAFATDFKRLGSEFKQEMCDYGLDALVVASLLPSFKIIMSKWHVLQDPLQGADVLESWIGVLDPGNTLEGIPLKANKRRTTPMTAYENLMYSLWLPRIRQAVK